MLGLEPVLVPEPEPVLVLGLEPVLVLGLEPVLVPEPVGHIRLETIHLSTQSVMRLEIISSSFLSPLFEMLRACNYYNKLLHISPPVILKQDGTCLITPETNHTRIRIKQFKLIVKS